MTLVKEIKSQKRFQASIPESIIGSVNIPSLSAAIATPPLNLTATTDVPVTVGDEVCVTGPDVLRYDGL